MPNNRGFAAMDPQKHREIASMGGRSQGMHNNPANFAHNPKRASEAGRMGGQKRAQNMKGSPGEQE